MGLVALVYVASSMALPTIDTNMHKTNTHTIPCICRRWYLGAKILRCLSLIK